MYVVVLAGGLQLLGSQRGVSDAGVGKPFLAEGRIGLSNPIASLHICMNVGVSQQQCGKEIMWLQTEGNEPGVMLVRRWLPLPCLTDGLWIHGIFL